MTRLLDSNIVIYSSNPSYAFLLPLFSVPKTGVSAISIPEVFGFSKLSPAEEAKFRGVFLRLTVYEITRPILYRAAELKQKKKLKLGDAIVAATALEHGCELVTRNENDFKGIAGLSILNPFKQP